MRRKGVSIKSLHSSWHVEVSLRAQGHTGLIVLGTQEGQTPGAEDTSSGNTCGFCSKTFTHVEKQLWWHACRVYQWIQSSSQEEVMQYINMSEAHNEPPVFAQFTQGELQYTGKRMGESMRHLYLDKPAWQKQTGTQRIVASLGSSLASLDFSGACCCWKQMQAK